MTIPALYATATGISGIKEVTVTESYGAASTIAEIVATGPITAQIGDLCTVDMGYVGNHQAMITNGRVKSITPRVPEFDFTITVHDKLSQAVDDFMAADDPEHPFEVFNRSGEGLVTDLLAHAGITGVTTQPTGFTFAVVGPSPINLISAWDSVDDVCRITGFVCFVEPDGTVKFTQRKPYIVGGDASAHTFAGGNSGDILEISAPRNDDKLRNRVVCYGSPGIHAVASASSPYVPSGFFKSLVVAHPLIDSLTQAQQTCNINLTMFNRLTESVRIQALGIPSLHCRDIVDVVEPFCNLSAGQLWFTHAVKHMITASGYSSEFTLSR